MIPLIKRCGAGTRWIGCFIMTKNKKRKSALREISAVNGVSMTRAALLNDRGRENSVLDEILEHERNLSWYLKPLPEFQHLVGDVIQIHCDSNTAQTLLWSSDVIRQKRGIPHYVIDGGTWDQHVRFLDGIRNQIDAMPEAYSEQIGWSDDFKENNMVRVLSRLESEQQRRNDSLENLGLNHFGDLRVRSLGDSGRDKTNEEYPYFYVFIYDWNALMAGRTDSFVERFRALIAEGKTTGMHFIVATSGAYTDVAGGDKRAALKNILIRNIEDDGLETAGMFCYREWIKFEFPKGELIYS
jgi:hypothetical protein